MLDIRSKNSRKAGVIAVALLLAFCSVMMLSGYPQMSSYLESAESEESAYEEALYGMGGDLAEGNYILYNEYAKSTDPGEVLDEFGQRKFDLTRKYMDCDVFAAADDSGENETGEQADDTASAGESASEGEASRRQSHGLPNRRKTWG